MTEKTANVPAQIRQNDREVRKALHNKVLKAHRYDGDTLIIDELGLRHGTCRVDVAVVNGRLHGYEIKSDSDTLERLPQQIAVYGEIFDRVTLIVGEKHAEKSITQIPSWWGVKVATTGPNGTKFEHYRRESNNRDINPLALAELLWRPEVVSILQGLGAPAPILKKPRAVLYAYLAESVELNELRRLVRTTLKARTDWRGQRPPSLDAG
ncbi:hypothetical protein CCAX7_000690 [Capsulimonas corticalis]|uniref:Uncharacterized protein n=1 Tax=Capsulimonas corticalis TaxID=2219043 RepID=A0A402CR93_9BACT|nr:sce7726 family protein [Capsulimonas corticalis]BDI28018.1 hypothetical protein CCAX7_000690 [Capsulimonas corticalis]